MVQEEQPLVQCFEEQLEARPNAFDAGKPLKRKADSRMLTHNFVCMHAHVHSHVAAVTHLHVDTQLAPVCQALA